MHDTCCATFNEMNVYKKHGFLDGVLCRFLVRQIETKFLENFFQRELFDKLNGTPRNFNVVI